MNTVIIGEPSGFCSGVKKAVGTAYDMQKIYGGDFCTLGEIVHNPKVLSELKSNGICMVPDTKSLPKGIKRVLVRAHGLPKVDIEELGMCGCEVWDMTCSNVTRIHEIVAQESLKCRSVVVAGAPAHPEVVGIIGWAAPGVETFVVETAEQAEELAEELAERFASEEKTVCLVAQTTFRHQTYNEIKHIFKNRLKGVSIHETICGDTAKRQYAIRKLAPDADAVIVVGGKKSSNSTKLFQIASELCKNTQHIESADDLDLEKLSGCTRIVLFSGASTPKESLEEVKRKIEER